MKKIKMILSLLLSLIIAVPFAGIAVNAESTVLTQNTVIRSGNTYYINNSDDLKTLSILINEKSQDCTGATIELTDDIYLNKGRLSYEDGTPMYGGEAISENNAPSLFRSMAIFKGTFDGKGHTISGLYSKGSGLFEEIANASIKDLKIANSMFISKSENTGALCGCASDSVISGCSFSGVVYNTSDYTGGLVGLITRGEIRYSKNNGSVYGKNYVGGIAGTISENTLLFGLCNSGSVSASEQYAGGLAGSLSIGENSYMKYCCNTGEVFADSLSGGFAGKMHVEGDDLQEVINDLEYMEFMIDMWRRSVGGGYIIAVWPPPGLEEYIDIDEYERLRGKLNKYQNNIINCYSAGTVTSAQYKKRGSVCGEFTGCAWNFKNCWVNDSDMDPANYIYLLSKNTLDYGPQRGINFKLDELMKTEDFADILSNDEAVFVADTVNDNHGYPVLLGVQNTAEHEHNFTSEITTEPTCTEKGVRTYTCECGAEYTEAINAKGHSFVFHHHIPATCTNTEYDAYQCTVCGYGEKRSVGPNLGHDYEEEIIQEKTCTTNGIVKRTCKRCGMTYEKKIWAEHNYVTVSEKAATCTEDGYKNEICTVCGEIRNQVFKASHMRSKVYKSKEPTCTEDGLWYYHCDRCNEDIREIRPATGHDWYSNSSPYILHRICTLCQKSDYGAEKFELYGGQNHHREGNTVYYPYKNLTEFVPLVTVFTRIDFELWYDVTTLDFKEINLSPELKNEGARIEITSIKNGTVKFSLFALCAESLRVDEILFDVQYDVIQENFIKSNGAVNRVTELNGNVFTGWSSDDDLIGWIYGDYTNGAVSGTQTYEDLTREYRDYVPVSVKKSSVESVSYEPSDSALNDYTFKVNGQAVKIAFLFRNNSTLTVARSGAKIKSFDKDGNEVPQGSKNIDYELWTVHRSLKVNEEIKVRAKFSTGWEDEFKSFTVYLKYQELPFVESVTYTPSFSAENDYVLKVNCIADKVQFINPNGTTATYTKSSAKSVVSFDKNGNEVPVNSKDTAYEIWTVHRTMKTDCEMFVHVKTGGKWENETKAFIVELKKKDVSSIESVTWKGDAVSRNDYYIKVNGRPDKIAFVNPDGTTATYSRDKAKIKCYDANGNEVPSDSKNISYEIWTINRSMRMNVEMRAVAKFGKTTETEMFTFTVK